jgi:hypothetical protein
LAKVITDVDDINALIVPGVSSLVGTTLTNVGTAGSKVTQHGLRIARGKIVVTESCILPLIEDKTSTAFFYHYNRAKLAHVLNTPPPYRGAIADAVVAAGHPWYYHFLAQHLPALLLLQCTSDNPCTWATLYGYPTHLTPFVMDFIPRLVAPRAAQAVTLQPGIYDVENVILAMISHYGLAPAMGRQLILPMMTGRAGLRDPLRDLGPVKLFVRRDGKTSGRNLLNQPEVEAWFTARGFTSVDPGALDFADQAILFSRATHIAGVEGGAMTNLMFAANVRQLVLIGAPVTYQDRFFHGMVADYGVTVHSLYGHYVGAPPFARNADFVFPVKELDALWPEATV